MKNAASLLPPREQRSEFLQASGLTVGEITATRTTATLTLDARHHTPWGVVHGGVYATAAESAASVGASAAVADQGMFAVGLSNTTDYRRSTIRGELEVDAAAIHQGRTQQLWQVTTRRADGKEVARSHLRLQNVALPQPPQKP